MKTRLLFICLTLITSGCVLFHGKQPDPKPAAPITTANDASVALNAKEAELKGRVAANIETARKANATQPESAAKNTIEGELALGSNRLDVKADPAELLAGEQRARAIAEGRTEEARKLYADAAKQANEDAKARAKAEADLRVALAKQASDAEKYAKDLAAMKASYEQQIDSARNEVMKDQVKWLNRAAAACAAIALGAIGLSLAFGGIAAIRVVAPFALVVGVGALGCFGLAQIVGLWWFKWAVLTLALGVAAWIAVWTVKHYRQGNLKQEAESKAASYKNALSQIVPVLDKAYEDAESSTKTILDNLIFSKLSSLMDKKDKSVVHSIRADDGK